MKKSFSLTKALKEMFVQKDCPNWPLKHRCTNQESLIMAGTLVINDKILSADYQIESLKFTMINITYCMGDFTYEEISRTGDETEFMKFTTINTSD